MNRLVDYVITAVIVMAVIVILDRTSDASALEVKYEVPHRLPYTPGRLV